MKHYSISELMDHLEDTERVIYDGKTNYTCFCQYDVEECIEIAREALSRLSKMIIIGHGKSIEEEE